MCESVEAGMSSTTPSSVADGVSSDIMSLTFDEFPPSKGTTNCSISAFDMLFLLPISLIKGRSFDKSNVFCCSLGGAMLSASVLLFSIFSNCAFCPFFVNLVGNCP